MSATVAEILDAAANHIEEVGWHQGTFADYSQLHYAARHTSADVAGSDTCRVCVWGAIRWAAAGYPWAFETPVAKDAVALLEDRLGVGYLPDWNDAPERTQDEVVAALRAAAESVRES